MRIDNGRTTDADVDRISTPTANHHKGKTGLVRVYNALFYSFAGLQAAYRNEDAFRQELILAVILCPLAFTIGTSGLEISALIGTVLLVLIVELLNSAVESVTDRVSLADHELAKRAKDMGSAAVLLSLGNMAATWFFILVW